MFPLVDTLTGDTISYLRLWSTVYDDYAWNFAFNGDTVFAATNNGLIWSEGDGIAQGIWDTLSFEDSLGVPLILPGTEVYAVDVIGDYLWVGTDDRTIRVRLDNLEDQLPLYVIDSVDEVYAFPVPFSHSLDDFVEFHFMVKESANITLEVYDFAMNLVKRVVDNEFFEAGVYPTAGSGRKLWDGYNGKGDKVAVGMYYFKVEYSTGETRWGKLAIIP